VRQELQAKGLPVEAIAEAVQEMRSTELERAREVWRKKFGEPPNDQAARVKQVRFLVSRGFAPEVVKRVVAGAEDF
jgi:regulatory protein